MTGISEKFTELHNTVIQNNSLNSTMILKTRQSQVCYIRFFFFESKCISTWKGCRIWLELMEGVVTCFEVLDLFCTLQNSAGIRHQSVYKSWNIISSLAGTAEDDFESMILISFGNICPLITVK